MGVISFHNNFAKEAVKVNQFVVQLSILRSDCFYLSHLIMGYSADSSDY